MKKETLLAIGGAALLTGCGDTTEVEKVRIVYKDPTPAQIQAAVDKALLDLNREDEEIKAFLKQIQKTEPDVVGARYAYENGEKVLKLAMNDEDRPSGLVEYTVPVTSAALAGYTGAALANKLSSYTHDGYVGRGDCDLDDLLEGDSDCYENRGSSGSSSHTYIHFRSYPSYHYDDMSYYRSTVKKDRKVYSQKSSKKSASERAKAIKDNAKKNTQRSVSSTSRGYESNSSKVVKSTTYSAPKTETKPKATLTPSRQAFSTKRSSARTSSMSFGSSSRSSSYGG